MLALAFGGRGEWRKKKADDNPHSPNIQHTVTHWVGLQYHTLLWTGHLAMKSTQDNAVLPTSDGKHAVSLANLSASDIQLRSTPQGKETQTTQIGRAHV